MLDGGFQKRIKNPIGFEKDVLTCLTRIDDKNVKQIDSSCGKFHAFLLNDIHILPIAKNQILRFTNAEKVNGRFKTFSKIMMKKAQNANKKIITIRQGEITQPPTDNDVEFIRQKLATA